MTLSEYLNSQLPKLASKKRPKTIWGCGLAVRRLCSWRGKDVDLADVTPELVDEFEAKSGAKSARQLACYLRALMREHDPDGFAERVRRLQRPTSPQPLPAPASVKNRRKDGRVTLVEFAEDYLQSHAGSAMYASTVRRRAVAIERFVGKSALVDVLTMDNVNAYLAALSVSPHTRKSYRGDVLMLWRAAADEDLLPYPNSRKLRRERLPALLIECYSMEEVQSLIATAMRLRGGLPNGVARRHYWPAVIRLAWDSGLRRNDCLRFDRTALRTDCTFRMVQGKTGQVVRRKLRPSTVAALGQIDGGTPLAWPLSLWAFADQFRKIVNLAGVNRGTFKWLRRASGSYAESLQPGAGSKVLGHADPTMFRKHYDAQIDGEVPMPPELEGGAA